MKSPQRYAIYTIALTLAYLNQLAADNGTNRQAIDAAYAAAIAQCKATAVALLNNADSIRRDRVQDPARRWKNAGFLSSSYSLEQLPTVLESLSRDSRVNRWGEVLCP
jgi:hypothetical protein